MTKEATARNTARRRVAHAKVLAYHASAGKAKKLAAVPRGTARMLRRKPLQVAWAEKNG